MDQGFIERTQTYCEHATAAARTWYDADGHWVAPTLESGTRDRYWLSLGLYAAGATDLANAVCRQGETEKYGEVRYNIFDTNIAAALLLHHREKMADDVRAKLEALVRDGFSFKPGNRQPDYQFHGYNDNMPAKATLGLVIGGELLDDADAVEYGRWNLRQLRAMLVRSGINSEWNSPTYSALTIHAMGEIAQYARDPECRELALGIETRLWLDLAARFHPETGVLAGPYARAYTVDTIAQISCAAAMLWFVLGDRSRPSPMLLFDPPMDLVVHHMGDYPFNIAQMCWYAAGCFHVPAAAQRMFESKTYPFRAAAGAELGDGGVDFPARRVRIDTFLQPDFTVGTATTPFCGGEQTMSYFATYRRTAEVTSFRDVGTVFSKLVVNDGVPGAVTGPGKDWTNRGEEDCLHARANPFVLQSDATALVLTHPHLALGGDADTLEGATPLTRLSELIIFPSHFGGADELIVAGEPRDAWDGHVPQGEWIVCRRGRMLIALRPLAYSRTLGHARITLETHNNYQVVRATWYDGQERTFTRGELRHIFGGFVAEHASIDEFDELSAFAAYVQQAQFTDYFWTTRRVRYRRPEVMARPAVEFEVSWSPGTHAPRIAAINGQQVEIPVTEIDGLTTADFPFLGEPFTPVPSFFPWQDFTVEWGDWPWAIGDREA